VRKVLKEAAMPNRRLAAMLAVLAVAMTVLAAPPTFAQSDETTRGIAKCNAVLAGIRKVSAAKVAAFEGNSWVLPLCQTTAEMRAADLDRSKAAGLIDAIAGNAGLMKTLKSKRYSIDQIVGFSISVDGARIYVHGQ
jgi:hypothetical protein